MPQDPVTLFILNTKQNFMNGKSRKYFSYLCLFATYPNFTPVLPYISKRHLTVLKAPCQGSVAPQGQQAVSGKLE